MSDSLWPHGLQHARLSCPSPTHWTVSVHPIGYWSCSLELAQTHVHWVGDAIQPSHPLSSPSPPAFDLSQHQGLFQWVSSSCQVAKVLEFQLQHQSFQWVLVLPMNIQDWFPLGWTGLIFLQSKGLSKVLSNTTVQKHNSSALSFLFSPTLTSIHDYWKNHSFD